MAKAKRKAKKVTIEELKSYIGTKFEKAGETFDEEELDFYALLEVAPKIEKDVSKITFDFENVTISPDEFGDTIELAGWNEIDGFSFLGVAAGGDWEIPVFFIVYLDPTNTLRAYVPTEGNVFNQKTKEAYGNDEDADEEEAKKLGFASYEDLFDEDLYDFSKILSDIFNRIEVV